MFSGGRESELGANELMVITNTCPIFKSWDKKFDCGTVETLVV